MTHLAYVVLRAAKLRVDKHGYVDFSTLRHREFKSMEKKTYFKLLSELVDCGKVTFPGGSARQGRIQ